MSAVAVFSGINGVEGNVLFTAHSHGCRVVADFSKLPEGEHGFHIHRAGDLRGEGCQGACDHYHKGKAQNHGGPPSHKGDRHTGDLGNISGPACRASFILKDVAVHELYGRSVIVHEDADDYGKGGQTNSLTTGNSGKRIGCAIIGRVDTPSCVKKTRKSTRV
jgi:Cu-Zn family superoxide dismutase